MSTAVEIDRSPYADLWVGPNRVTLLKDGLQTFPAMLEAASSARSTLCLETYILGDDPVGEKWANVLIERSYAGVEVNLVYDAWGTEVSTAYLQRLRLAGVRVLPFGLVPWFSSFSRVVRHLRRRNHRKSMIVDGRIGFTGGLNLTNEYAAVEDGGDGWRDTHLRIEGPAAVQLERMFLTTWQRHGGPAIDAARYRRVPTAETSNEVRIVGNDFAADRKDIRRAYIRAFNVARERILVTNSYFMPPHRVLRSLLKAARRGVEVIIIVPGTTDVPLVMHAARGLYGKLLRAKARIFEFKGRILHAKTAVVDGTWCTVGSTNLDSLSLRENLEVNAIVVDPRLGQAMEKLFNEDLFHCVEITPRTLEERSLFDRFLSWVAYQVRSWL